MASSMDCFHTGEALGPFDPAIKLGNAQKHVIDSFRNRSKAQIRIH